MNKRNKGGWFNRLDISIIVLVIVGIVFTGCQSADKNEETGGDILLLNDDASWCWYQDERAMLDGDQLLFSAVTSEGANTVSSYNIATGEQQTVVLNDTTFQPDDHNVGVLLKRPDGRYLTVYAGHGVDTKMWYRISSSPGDISEWGPEQTADTREEVTYSNVYRLSDNGKVYNFHRGIGWNPNYMVSEDEGESWRYGGQLLAHPGRPYLRYTSNNSDQIHFIATEGHPRNYNNSIYHGYTDGKQVYGSGGQAVGPLSGEESTDLKPYDFTTVFDGDSTTRANVAWTSDIELDGEGRPYVAFSVTKDPIALGEREQTEKAGFDHRYHYARWDGEQWQEHEIAYAGSRLYPGENEYTGLITLHPDDPDVVYISADVDPATGEELNPEGPRRYEIFRGTTGDRGASWEWTPITEDSDQDNIRPVVVSNDRYEAVLWLNGRYSTYTDYDLDVLGIISERED
ncbi:BNR repeat-containing family member [Fodinibius roseus]|uniref:BNR repeat-containing family member n=1 Tax=Fodinibius roseus TaxID=1194090 RepID=A0A1M5L5S6_9BACT|nr:BNR-4 repeat-containing protein [Fodinibius roseus]SHG60368.1 BNR repeat-containing family member [Fodinibius roseus]